MLLQQAIPAAPQAPAPPTGLPRQSVQVLIDGKPINATPEQLFKAAEHQREELGNQMDRLKDERRDITNRLGGEEQLSSADKAGLEKRLTAIDGRIEQLDNQIAAADAQVASTAAIPGAIVERPPEVRHGPPEEVFILGGIFMFVAIMPISIAYARRIWRRSAAAVAALPHDIVERFTQIDQAVESIAVEVERIGEGQRFITRVLSEQGRPALAEPGARGVEVRARPNG
jgi:cytochrome c biogenesis protein ResB